MKGVLKEIVDKIEALKWNYGLYVAQGELSLNSLVAVIEDDGVSEIFEGCSIFYQSRIFSQL